MDEARDGKRKVCFVDAAHFVHKPLLGYVWYFERLFIKAPSGRQRFNVLGALDAITRETVVVTNDSHINADSLAELLKLLAARHPEPGLPVSLILNNARYQKCEAVTEMAEIPDIELVYLPTYSPNLNLIERLWKLVKKKCLNSKYYESFAEFKGAILECLGKLGSDYKEELASLLSLKFQTFSKSQILAA